MATNTSPKGPLASSDSTQLQEEFLHVFLAHEFDLRAFILALVRDPSVSDDLFQDVSIVLWRRFGEYDRSRSFGSWARGVAWLKIRKERSDRMAKAIHVQLDEHAFEAIDAAFNANPEESARHVLKQEALRRCLNDLPSKARLIFDLKYQDRMALQEIAKRSGNSLTGVTKGLSRLRQQLAQCIQKRLSTSAET